MSRFSINRPKNRENGLAALLIMLVVAGLVSIAAQMVAFVGNPQAITYADNGLGRSGTRDAVESDPPGNNGTVKIHEGDTEAEPIRRNEPHVCTFHLHGFNFDDESSGEWRIVEWPPTGDGNTVVASGSWGPAAEGEWRTPVMSLPDGHYKLYWQQTDPEAPGGEKHKVFWVECAVATETPNATNTVVAA